MCILANNRLPCQKIIKKKVPKFQKKNYIIASKIEKYHDNTNGSNCAKILTEGKFLRDSWKICSIKAFQMMEFERRDDSKLHLYIGFC